MSDFRCTIVTPSESVLDEQATYVTFEAWDGQKGVATGCSPFLVRLGSGEVRIDTVGGAKHSYVLDGGFAQMQKSELVLLADSAAAVASIDAAAAARDLKAANERATATNPKPLSLDERESIERAQRSAQSRVVLARTRA
ncbi:MAG: F0F1 ATP synthase subunit epsilon [Phycisphaerales bacterium]|nr:F0F1 ATP synthase subunit epsilon [Phycisphaerales bacterium]